MHDRFNHVLRRLAYGTGRDLNYSVLDKIDQNFFNHAPEHVTEAVSSEITELYTDQAQYFRPGNEVVPMGCRGSCRVFRRCGHLVDGGVTWFISVLWRRRDPRWHRERGGRNHRKCGRCRHRRRPVGRGWTRL